MQIAIAALCLMAALVSAEFTGIAFDNDGNFATNGFRGDGDIGGGNGNNVVLCGVGANTAANYNVTMASRYDVTYNNTYDIDVDVGNQYAGQGGTRKNRWRDQSLLNKLIHSHVLFVS